MKKEKSKSKIVVAPGKVVATGEFGYKLSMVKGRAVAVKPWRTPVRRVENHEED